MKRSMFTRALALMLLIFLLLPSAALAEHVRMSVKGGSLYLRSGPGRDYSATTTVHDGDYITVITYGSVWSEIETQSGRTGYIKNLYIDDGDLTYAAGTDYVDSYSAYTTASVNLRAGASTSTEVITVLSKGTKVSVLGVNDDFYLVQTGNGTQGYVSSQYISRKQSGGTSTQGKTKTVTASYVNVREGGGMHYPVLCVLPRGTRVSVLKVGNYWTRIQYGKTIGWIKNTYLK